jgi:hypothetical protein
MKAGQMPGGPKNHTETENLLRTQRLRAHARNIGRIKRAHPVRSKTYWPCRGDIGEEFGEEGEIWILNQTRSSKANKKLGKVHFSIL